MYKQQKAIINKRETTARNVKSRKCRTKIFIVYFLKTVKVIEYQKPLLISKS